jgi:uncharacterized protein YkwD
MRAPCRFLAVLAASAGLLGCAALEQAASSMPTASSRNDKGSIETRPPQREQSPPADELRGLERQAIAAVNDERAKHDAPPLVERAELSDLARAHSRDMARRRYFSHRSPDGDDVSDRVRAGGIAYRKVGENIQQSRGYEDPVATAIDSWLRSSGHRKILLDPEYTETGLGVALDEEGQYIFTQVFLLPG